MSIVLKDDIKEVGARACGVKDTRPLKIAMIGAGSAFTLNVAETLSHSIFENCEFFLMDVDENSLERARHAVAEVIHDRGYRLRLRVTTELGAALAGADYVIISCEQNRYKHWISDITIPEKHGIFQVTGENGGPGGLIHSLRNISMLLPIVSAVKKYCPDAWLLNLTNPMSVLCTYLMKYTDLKTVGFCHQVHGTVGVVAEQLGFEAGELQAVSAGINHMNWLFDLRRRSTGQSYLNEFFEQIRKSEWWKTVDDRVPDHRFSLDILDVFGMYPIGYDNHICEYFSCFYDHDEWSRYSIKSKVDGFLSPYVEGKKNTMDETLKAQHLMAGGEVGVYPFPRDPSHPYYHETLCQVIAALETNEPLYLDAMVGLNCGAITNLPDDAIVDRPVLVVGGSVRSVNVGALPAGPLEVCRRQIALHEMIAKAAVEGDEKLVIQALCLDPYVKSINQAKAVWRDYLSEYSDLLPTFNR